MKVAHRSCDEEPREEIEEGIESSSKYRSNLTIWRYRDSHHAVVSEVQERQEGNIKEPQELYYCPLERHHRVDDNSIKHSLNEHIWYLHDNLNRQIQWIGIKQLCIVY